MKKAFLAVLAFLLCIPCASAATLGDIDGDGKITLNEAIYALQAVAGVQGQGVTPQEQEGLQESTDQTLLYTTDPDGETAVDSLATLFEALGLIAAVESGNAYAYLSNPANFSCGSVAVVDGDTLSFTLSACGMTGTVEVTISTDGQYTVFAMTCTDVNVDGCVVNGAATVKVGVSGDTAEIIVESTGLSVCGVALNGSITVVLNKNTGEFQNVTVANTVSYTMDDGTEVEIDADITYNNDGSIDGTAATTIGGQTYNFVIQDVIVDPACGIPTSGAIAINGFTMDFSSTTCDDPTVTVYIRGVPVQMDLVDALNLVLGEDAVNFFLEELANSLTGVEEMDQVVEQMNLDDSMQDGRKALTDPDTVFNNLKTVEFACGTLTPSLINRSVTFTFDPDSDCGMGGVITVTVTKPDSAIVFELDYGNVTVGECTLDGQASSSLAFGLGVITYTHASTNLTACGVTLNGQFVLEVNAADGSLNSASIENTASFNTDDGVVTVASDLTVTPSGVNGSAVVDSDGKVYNFTLNDITIDPACGIPNGGTMDVNGVTLDFSQTSCDNPVVTVTVRGVSVQMPLEDAVNLLKSGDPAAYMVSYLSGVDEVAQGMEGVQEVLEKAGLKNAQEKNGYGERKSDAVDAILSDIQSDFTCGAATLNVPGKSVELAFDGSCGITGTLVITGSLAGDDVRYSMDYDNVMVEGCTIDGKTTAILAFGDGAIVFTHTSNGLSVCGNVVSGTATVSIDAATGSLASVVLDSQASFTANQKEVAVDAWVVYIPGLGLSGEAELTVDGREYACTFENITIDPACGIPNGGTLAINGITLDFSETTCDDPTVAVSAGNLSTTMSMEDVLDLLMSEDPLNAFIAAASGDSKGQEMVGDILDEIGLWQAENSLRSRKAITADDLLGFFTGPSGFDFTCGTLGVSLIQKTITVTFDGSCGVTGSMVVTVSRENEAFQYAITYTNVAMSGCTINGSAAGHLVFGTGTVTFVHTSSNLMVCGSTFNGTSSIVLSTADGSVQSATVDSQISFAMDGETINVDADLTYDSTGINGAARIKKGRKTYNCTFTNVTVDPACGIPNGGTATINGIPVDFSQTTCEDPTVIVTIRGKSVTMSLADAKALLS